MIIYIFNKGVRIIMDFKNFEFNKLNANENNTNQRQNIDLLSELSINISVEVGTTIMKIKDVLNSTIGTVIELNKTSGEPVDILANGKLIARGEIVVINEDQFGVKIIEFVNKNNRG